MGRSINARSAAQVDINSVPIGGIGNAFRSGEKFKAIGEVLSRTEYPELSASFPRNGSVSSFAATGLATGLVGLAFGLGQFVALDEGGAFWTSPDGDDWMRRGTLPAITSRKYTGLAFGNGRFVAVAGGNTGETTTCYVTTDLLTWTAGTMPNARWAAITYGDKFVAVSHDNGVTPVTYAATSTDGITWVQRTLPGVYDYHKVVYGAGVYVAIAPGTVAASSPDGITWTARTLPDIGGNFVDAVHGGGAFVAVGSGNIVARSTDGLSWAPVRLNVLSQSLDSIAYGNGLHLAMGTSGRAWASYDAGVTWSRKSVVGVTGKAMTYGNGRFFCMSGGGGIVVFAENLTTSDDMYLAGTAGQFVRVK